MGNDKAGGVMLPALFHYAELVSILVSIFISKYALVIHINHPVHNIAKPNGKQEKNNKSSVLPIDITLLVW